MEVSVIINVMKLLKISGTLFLSLFLSFFILPVIVFGHGTGGTFEEVVGGYKVDVGYEPENVLSGESLRLDFDLYDLQDKEVEFTEVWVNVSQENKTVFAGEINRSFIGGAGMTIVLSNPGEYKVSVRYENGDKSIVEASFPLLVENSDAIKDDSEFSGSKISYIFGLAGLILGFGLKYIIDKK